MFDFWIREQSERRLDFAYDSGIDTRPYTQKFLTGRMYDLGSLEKAKAYFTVAAWMLTEPKDGGQECDFAHVDSADLYPRGVVFTPQKANRLELNTSQRFMHMKERIEMSGSDDDDFTSRFFDNHISKFKKKEARDWHALLYRSDVEDFDVVVPGSFPIEDLDRFLKRGVVLNGEGVRGSKYIGVISVKGRKLQFSNWSRHVDESGRNMPGHLMDFVEGKMPG